MKVQDILTDESKWTKTQAAADMNGVYVSPTDDAAACWCLWGAIYKCYGYRTEQSLDIEERLMAVPAIKAAWGYICWNDAPERTFAEVRGLIEELDI